jgi:hypothetical protein
MVRTTGDGSEVEYFTWHHGDRNKKKPTTAKELEQTMASSVGASLRERGREVEGGKRRGKGMFVYKCVGVEQL